MEPTARRGRAVRALRSTRALAIICLGGASAPALAQTGPLTPPVFPTENAFSAEKSTLGKALFWDAQLSSDNTVSCGTCHIPASFGADPRTALSPGPDLIFGNDDDIHASPGVSSSDVADEYLRSVIFGLTPQVTSRLAQPAVLAMFAPELFWDGRATGVFTDPLTDEVLIAQGGALESQALGPILSEVEMAHQGRTWDQVTQKLARVRPMALASDLPADLRDALLHRPTYPDLFEAAFDDPDITPARIAMAIATYERALLPDQTPFDAFAAGDQGALSGAQINGMNALMGSRCFGCHSGPEFTDHTFRNIGLRPINEDRGRAGVTADPADRGRFKVPTLRGVGERERFMHNGQLATLEEVFDFYARRNGQQSFAQNRDPLLNNPIAFPPPVQRDIIDFLTNALSDPRLVSESPPFDRPSLLSESDQPNPLIVPAGIAGTDGRTPQIIALSPPNLGNDAFKIGIDHATPGAQAWLAVSQSPPIQGLLEAEVLLGPVTLHDGAGEGYATMPYPIPDIVALDTHTEYLQWLVADPGAPGGMAASPAARLTYFCSRSGFCDDRCPADLTGDGQINFFDVSAFLSAYDAQDDSADLTGDGVLNFFDISAFLAFYSEGCP